MKPFLSTYGELLADFRFHKIPTSEQGFYDHPCFVGIEGSNPNYLNHYAAFVAKQPYTQEYLTRAQEVIEKVASLLHKELLSNSRLGACIDISQILSRILEKEGIWNCLIKGSLTISFPPETNILPLFCWSLSKKEISAGHAWIFAPPYTVVDISIKQQPYDKMENYYIPETILSLENKSVDVDISEIVEPEFFPEYSEEELWKHVPLFPDIQKTFPAISIQTKTGTTFKYIPVAVSAPDASFEKMRNMDFNGLTPWELYSSKLKGVIQSI
jgi:hypothetical protein